MKIPKKLLRYFVILSLCFLATSLDCRAERGWIDVTNQYILSPSFAHNNNDGWTWESDAHSQAVRCEAMEFWNGTWNLWQTAYNLPAGTYRLSVQAFYRMGENTDSYPYYLMGTEDITGMMYAGQHEQPLVSVYSYHFPEDNTPGGCWSVWNDDDKQVYAFPNGMESGTAAFSLGAYDNVMTFEHEGGDLQLGLRNETWRQSNWCLFDNFRLEYYGEIVPVQPMTKGSVVINEIMASNVDQWVSPATNFDGWIELYNTTDQPVTLGGIYISDDHENLRKWHTPTDLGNIPAKGFFTLWFDSNDIRQQQAPFSLDVDGGTIYISDESGQVIVSQDYPASMERVSYARTTDGGDKWGTTAYATPGQSNKDATFAQEQLAAPVVNEPSQLFSGTLVVNVDIPAGCTLCYTTDGTLPELSGGSISHTGQFIVNETACYRFRLFADDYLPSPTTTRSYIYNSHDFSSLPVLSVISDPAFLYDNLLGVYVRGTNGRPGNGQSSPCNWNMNWERPVNLSYLDTNGDMVLNQDVNLEMCGGWSRAWEPHAFKLKGSKELGGSKKLPYPFFSAKPYINNRTLQVRNGGNDNSCRIKDPAIATLVQTSGIDIDLQSYQPVHEFINGQYIGVLNVREPNNKHYVYANYGWDDDEIDQFEISPDSFYVQKCGSDAVYRNLVELSAYSSDPVIYNQIRQILNVDEYINYMAAEFYLGSGDWTRNNVKAFRLRDGGRFRFVMFDTDGAFQLGSNMFQNFLNLEYNYRFDLLYPSHTYYYADNTLVRLFRQLMRNKEFCRQFVDTYCMMGGSVFEENRCATIINQLTAVTAPAMQIKGESPYSTANTMIQQFAGREQVMTSALQDFLVSSTPHTQYSTPITASLNSNASGARIEVNGVNVPLGTFKGHLFPPVKLHAVAPAGYVFEGWRNNIGQQTKVFPEGSVWQYYDQGDLGSAGWMFLSYNAGNWNAGQAPLGYNMTGVKTTISYGDDSRQKRPTYYFRRTFALDKKPLDDAIFCLNYSADDGFIVYVNGTEAGRYHMPSGNVDYNTYSTTWAGSTPDKGTIQISGNMFKEGQNIIAVEVHNTSASSSDIYWDCELTGDLTAASDNYISTDPYLDVSSPNTHNYTACYRPMTEAELSEDSMTPVRINEISAANSVFVNEYGKKNDWMELFNTTDKVQDIEGMFLTDDPDNLQKYQVTSRDASGQLHPALTKIPAHGRLIVWCDKLETTLQALHTSFKLAAEGGLVALTAADKSWTDRLYYPPHDGNQTVGRYPDGAGSVFLMTTPTIAQANLFNSYDQTTDQLALAIPSTFQQFNRSTFITSDGSLRISYVGDDLLLRSDETEVAQVGIYTADGQLVETINAQLHEGHSYISTNHLKPGLYIARATDEFGHCVSCRFIKN